MEAANLRVSVVKKSYRPKCRVQFFYSLWDVCYFESFYFLVCMKMHYYDRVLAFSNTLDIVDLQYIYS